MVDEHFKSVIQLRNPTGELIRFVEKKAADAGVKIVKREHHKDGVDMFLNSYDFVRDFESVLKKNFSGEMNITFRLITRKDNRNVYRITMLFRMHSFKRGDIISYRGDSCLVMSMGKKVELKDIKTHKKNFFEFSDVARSLRNS